jgi:general secretion pathway protein G
MAVASLVLGIVSLMFFIAAPLTGAVGIILGVISYRAAKQKNEPKGFATAGIVTSICGFVIGSLLFTLCMTSIFKPIQFSNPEFWGKSNGERIEAANEQLGQFREGLEAYYDDNKIYPTTVQGLNALYDKPTIEPIPKNYPKSGYFFVRIPLDPWGNKYEYENNGKYYKVTSYGADGKAGGSGDDADIIIENSMKK